MDSTAAGQPLALSPSAAGRTRPGTDLEEFGLAEGHLSWPRRDWLLTIDLEAFTPETVPLWTHAMDVWAAQASAHGHRFSVFVSVEDLVRLRAEDDAGYRSFTASMRRMADAGCEFHAHNHCVFDRDDGSRLAEPTPGDPPIPGYRKRPSMFYDVVRRHGLDLGGWLGEVLDVHREILIDAGIDAPLHPAYRAGGLDNGSTAEDLSLYVDALQSNGVRFDSSATAGAYATRSERVCSSFGQNLFTLRGGTVEAAPCLLLDCGASLLSRSWAGTTRRLVPQGRAWVGSGNGIFVVVIHLDHLFHLRPGRGYQLFEVTSDEAIVRRIDRFFGFLDRLRTVLRFGSLTFDDIEVEQPRPSTRRFTRAPLESPRAECSS